MFSRKCPQLWTNIMQNTYRVEGTENTRKVLINTEICIKNKLRYKILKCMH